MTPRKSQQDLPVGNLWKMTKKGRRNECWEFIGSRCDKGYGRVSVGGKIWTTHRLSWSATNGPIPDGMFVCHHCDNRCCVNPAHLFLGTNADNVRDMVQKNRMARGEKHGMSKLTQDDVIAIRTEYATGQTSQYKLAEKYGVRQTAIQKIVAKTKWQHVGDQSQ